MKWTLKIERVDEAGILESQVFGHSERPALGSEADLGLTHDDGKYLIRQIVAHDQVQSFISKTRPCRGCCGLRSIKDHRRRKIDTIFGHLRIRARRYEDCGCGQSNAPSPVAGLFPYRMTPELRHLQVKFGCKYSYQQAADILNEFLPIGACNHQRGGARFHPTIPLALQRIDQVPCSLRSAARPQQDRDWRGTPRHLSSSVRHRAHGGVRPTGVANRGPLARSPTA
jgi:hypothetical protein